MKNNVFQIGSCRLNYINNNKNTIVNRPIYFTHTTKEILQLLKFINGAKQNAIYKKAFPHDFEKKINNCIKIFDKSSIILIEISSIKELVDENKIYYNAVDLGRNYNNHILKVKIQKENELLNDINEIINILFKMNKKIDKIIFQGHFDNNIKNRTIIDNALRKIKKNNKNNKIDFIILKDIFIDENINKICKKRKDNNKIIDMNHFTQYGFDLIYEKFLTIIYSFIESSDNNSITSALP